MAELIPANGEIEVFVASSRKACRQAEIKRPFVAILPDADDWNDFGRKFFGHLYIAGEDKKSTTLHLRLMFEGQRRSIKILNKYLDQKGTIFPIEEIDIPFISILPNETDYRIIIEMLGFDLGISALRKLHDAVVAIQEGENQDLIDMTESEDFHIGIYRHLGAYTSMRRGARHFRPSLLEPVKDAAGKFNFYTHLINSKNEINIEFDLINTPIMNNRITVLIGRNGVGKTQLIKALIDGLHELADKPFEAYSPRYVPPLLVNRVLVFSSVPTDPFPREIAAWHGIDYEYFAVNSGNNDGVDTLLASLVACRFESPIVLDEGKGRLDKFSTLRSALQKIDLWDGLYLPLRPRQHDDDLPFVLEVDGESYIEFAKQLGELNSLKTSQQINWKNAPVVLDGNEKFRALSSGEYAMLRFAAQVVAAIEEGSLLLLDEPETHLHPNFISDLMGVLNEILQITKSIAIVATHSAYVIRETPRENVKVLSVEDGVISVDLPRLQTFGASIDTISQFVFGDTNINHYHQDVLQQLIAGQAEGSTIEEIVEKYGTILNSESLSFIARLLEREQ